MPNPSPSPSRFSEQESEQCHDAADALYRPFRDAEGNPRRGICNAPEAPGSVADARSEPRGAGSRLKEVTPESAGIDRIPRVPERAE